MPRLLLVSNRLPISTRLERGRARVDRSAGGLATALRGVHARPDTLWIGWPGDTSRLTTDQRAALAAELRASRLHAVPIAPSEVAAYYDGFSNGVLWPLFHYLLDRVPLDASWEAYVQVNERFADVVCELSEPGDTVWIHDYHLCLLPDLVRRRCPGIRVGFFLHIPFPSAEVFRTLAWRRPLLEGLLGSDVIGFHTAAYRRHFADAVALVLGHRCRRGSRDEALPLEVGVRSVRLVVTPIGVDAAAIAHTPSAAAPSHDGTRLLLGIDRLDYTKGIPRRMLAFERLLEREPSLRGSVRLLQVAVPSRERVDAYRQIRRQVEEHVGRINGLYTVGSSVPIHYVYRSLSAEDLVAHYRAADVMLVTPLRDGMNLVAKEFVAARDDLGAVLVLSELAGAAAELQAALQVNPYDIDEVATALARALTMPDTERRLRMDTLRRQVLAHDVHEWSSRFLAWLAPAATPPTATPWDPEDLLVALATAASRCIVLDYDGTLVPFAPRPELASPDPELLVLLRALCELPDTEVHLVSGRRRADLQRWFGALPVGLHGEHGLWSRWPGQSNWRMRPLPLADWKSVVRPVMVSEAARHAGGLVEEKTAALAFHFRDTPLTEAPAALRRALEEFARWLPVELIDGSRVLEVRARGVDKGSIVEGLRARGALDGAVLALGDDRTDADLFRALPADALTVAVGDLPLPARARLASPAEARAFLQRVRELRREPVPG